MSGENKAKSALDRLGLKYDNDPDSGDFIFDRNTIDYNKKNINPAGLATAKAMSEKERDKGTAYAKTSDKRAKSFGGGYEAGGGEVVKAVSGPDTRTSAEKIASAQRAADRDGTTLATGGGGKAEGGLMLKKKKKKTKGK